MGVPMLTKVSRSLSWFARFWRMVPILFVVGLVLQKMQPYFGWIGHDFYHAFIRLSIGAAHFWRNFFDIPHYTPSLCGGIPFFADPQATYFSVLQFLVFFIEPLTAYYISVVIFYLLGYWGAVTLFRRGFQFSQNVSHLGALAFSLNGFHFAHMYVGHTTHHTFMLFPWLIYFLIRRFQDKFDLFKQAICFSLVLIYMFYSGGLHMLVVFLICFLLGLPYFIYRRLENGEWKDWVLFGFVSFVILVLTCSGKFIASLLFSKHFIHAPIDSSGMPVAQLVFKYFWFDPENTPLFIQFGRFAFGPWEYVGFVSRAMIPALMVFGVFVWKGWNRKTGFVLAAYAFLIPFVCFLAAGTSLNTKLPFFNRYHNPIKILGAFVPWFAIIFAYCLHRFSLMMRLSHLWLKTVVFLIIAITLIAEFNIYARYFRENRLTLGYYHVPSQYESLHAARGIKRVDKIVEDRGTDLTGLGAGCSSLKCYEPLFGYQGERLRADLKVGPTAMVRDGRFNMTHPGCLLYPDYFGCQPWDRIKSDDKINFEKFIEGKTPDWGVPPWQSALYTLNFTILLLLWVPFVIHALMKRGILKSRLRLFPVPLNEGASA